MAKVTRHNGDNHGTAEGFTKYRFSGSPTDQFEHRGQVGEIRRMTVTVECVAEGYDQVNEGIRHQTKWKVTNAELGEHVERPAEPSLFDHEDEQDGDGYGDYRGEDQADAEDTDSNVITPQFSSGD